jgi:hypothetical protein
MPLLQILNSRQNLSKKILKAARKTYWIWKKNLQPAEKKGENQRQVYQLK